MEPKIEIHSDYCVYRDNNDIQNILFQITELITDATLRAAKQTEESDEAA